MLLNETQEGFDQGMRGDHGFNFGPKNTKIWKKASVAIFLQSIEVVRVQNIIHLRTYGLSKLPSRG